MFKFSNWFVCVTSLIVLFVVCEGRSAKQSKYKGVGVTVKLTETEKQAVVDRHNDYRRKEGASDMQQMVRRE